MKIELIDRTIRDLVAGDHDDDCVMVGFGGTTIEVNCQMLCRKCNREKAAK
jgi:hypothetical protein